MKAVIGVFFGGALTYTGLYLVYAAAARTMPTRIAFAAASVVGLVIGSTLGQRFFEK